MNSTILKTYKMYINGQFVRSEANFTYLLGGQYNIPKGTKKDLKAAVKAARAAFDGWSGRTAYNRGQILYRCAEMLELRKEEFAKLPELSMREVKDSINTFVYYAGWCDKITQVGGSVNQVSASFANYSSPEPMGVVGIVCPSTPGLLPLVQQMAAALAAGNTVVAALSFDNPLAALTLAEVLAVSDIPSGVINLVSGNSEMLSLIMAQHMDINALDITNSKNSNLKELEQQASLNLKRVVKKQDKLSPYSLLSLMEIKTVWHPSSI